MRGATDLAARFKYTALVSIHAPHAGRDRSPMLPTQRSGVSIHAPHAGRDQGFVADVLELLVSIHAPHAGRDKL